AEVKDAMDFIQAKGSPEAKIKFGQAYDEMMGEKMQITVIATGFPARRPQGLARRSLLAPGLARRNPLGDIPDLSPIEPQGSRNVDWSKPAFLHYKIKKLK
ncbi:MAG: hypothetical protein HY925_09845, partial [Elusimicrobia bacterium]|nr:hypothetical protein [Elusimicrobiota bacterium]